MARPFKKGVDYFPLDCVLDDKMRLIKAKFGLRGFAFVIILLQEIYGNEGYYYAIKENDFLLLINDSKIKQNLATDVIKYAADVGMFDKEKFLKYNILTSAGIQKRYFEIVKRRKEIELRGEYLCISYTQLRKIVNTNRINVYNNEVNADNNEQTKVLIYNEEEIEAFASEPAVNRKSFIEYFMQRVNATPSQVVISDIEAYENKMEYECFCAIIDYCIDENKRNWSYIRAVLNDKVNKCITTKKAFDADIALNKAQRENKNTASDKKPVHKVKEIITEIERIEF